MRLLRSICTLALVALFAVPAWAQSGRITGSVTEIGTGEPLPGVNVIIEGTTQGASTDADGFYSIINVSPGTYALRATFVGFTEQLVEDVRVNTGLTTTIDFELSEETVGLDEIVVAATRPIVQADVSANVASVSREEMEYLPVAGVEEVLDLQAGIEPGLQIRGGSGNEVAFIMDGMNMRTGRNQSPMTNISYTSLEEVQVQTGGFNAEYGNVRSGVVNVATKEPPRTSYTFDGIFRYTPAQQKYFNGGMGALPATCDFTSSDVSEECDNWFVRPVLDPAINATGRNTLDLYQRRQYANFTGWNGHIQKLRTDGFDVTQEDMIEWFRHTHRKDNSIETPDFNADVTVGGPLIPGLSQRLGDLRFLASYRGTQTGYANPHSIDAYTNRTFQAKVLSNIAPGMRVTLHGLITREEGLDDNPDDADLSLWGGGMPSYPWSGGNRQLTTDIRGDEVWTNAQTGTGTINYNMFGANFTHTLSANTFYEVSMQRLGEQYQADFPPGRDWSYVCPDSGTSPTIEGETCTPGVFYARNFTDQAGGLSVLGEENLAELLASGELNCFGGEEDLNGDGSATPYCVGDEPYGFSGLGGNLLTGESIGGHWHKTRDSTETAVWTSRFDLTSQVNRFLQMKTGAELIYSEYDMNYASVNLALNGPEPNEQYPWQQSPIQGAAYAQGKLEFQGMIANLGVRLDYFDSNTEWWDFTPYDIALRGRQDRLNDVLTKSDTKGQVSLSPRLGVSFPITENSKLYFNYGHFRQMLSPNAIFGIQQSQNGGIDEIGNPNHPMPKTVAYELGFDQNLFDQFLFRVSGYYRDIKNQPRTVTFQSLGNVVNYQTQRPWNYEDVRGFEVSVSKNRGNWLRGFANYTYHQEKSGNFGYGTIFQNSFEMQNFILSSTEYRLNVPVAQPFARFNAILLTPSGWGPELAGANPLGDWRFSVLGEWRQGQAFTYTGGGSGNEYVQNNMRWTDYWNWDLRVTKNIASSFGSMQLYADVSNVFNLRYLNRNTGFVDGNDSNAYLNSLHLSRDVFRQLPEGQGDLWPLIPGDDKPGDYRKPGVAWQPMEVANDITLQDQPSGSRLVDGNSVAWYFDRKTGNYFEWTGGDSGDWQQVSGDEVQQVLDDKAYIDMPNLPYFSFLNPRAVTFGVRVSF